MQQRSEPHDSLDDFPTPPWAVRALMEKVLFPRRGSEEMRRHEIVWDPACNRGYMMRGFAGYFCGTAGSDIHDYGAGWPVADFLWPDALAKIGMIDHPNWIITNPPFRLAAEFIAKCIHIMPRDGFAMLTRTSFLEGVGRHKGLFSVNPPSIIAQFAERVPMVKGRCDPTASTATSYCWLVWESDITRGTDFVWIPPCRKQLERAGDYA